MIQYISIIIFSFLASSVAYTYNERFISYKNRNNKYSATQSSELPSGAIDFTGYKLWVTFNGFNAKNMNCGIELKPKFEVEFSRGILSPSPGFWRIIGYEDGKTTLEATQPVTAEYMFFFDIWEPTILWRGNIDLENMKVSDGLVLNNKKRFGLFPYTETLATFDAILLPPDKDLPDVVTPKISDQTFVPPVDFISPNDMKLFPEIFDPEFVDWWFKYEDAIARGETPPERPKVVFTPNPNAKVNDYPSDSLEDVGGKLRQRRGPTGKNTNTFKK